MPSLSVVLRSLVAERRYLGFYAEVFLSASISGVQEAGKCKGDGGVAGAVSRTAIVSSDSFQVYSPKHTGAGCLFSQLPSHRYHSHTPLSSLYAAFTGPLSSFSLRPLNSMKKMYSQFATPLGRVLMLVRLSLYLPKTDRH